MPYEITSTCCGHTQIYKPREGKIKKGAHTNCKKCGKDFSINIETSEDIPKIPNLPKSKILKKTNLANPPQEEDFIDDPNELLLSCAMRELNKPTPEVRWANILLTLLDKTGRLETTTKEEVMVRSKLVKYSTNQLVELRKKLTSS